MGKLLVRVLLFVGSLLLCCGEIEGSLWNISKEEDLELERQIKLLNKPAVKIIVNRHGDTYGCVNFYDQPAFDHPLLKNHTINYQELLRASSSIDKNQRLIRENEYHEHIQLDIVDCPVGTVPIRRVTKEDVFNERIASNVSSMVQVYNYSSRAIVRTKVGPTLYSGAGAHISVQNPKVSGQQYSAARFKLQFGNNYSIQVGWRVDPTLYGGDVRTRFFIHTNAGQTNCFNTLCPGFVVVNPRLPVDSIIEKVSQPGGYRYILRVFIERDNNGNWNLLYQENKLLLGYWPLSLFSGLASYVEWGGEAYAPPGTPTPPMGEGAYIQNDTKYDAYFMAITEDNDHWLSVDATDIETYSDRFYSAKDYDYIDDYWRNTLIYGGPGGN